MFFFSLRYFLSAAFLYLCQPLFCVCGCCRCVWKIHLLSLSNTRLAFLERLPTFSPFLMDLRSPFLQRMFYSIKPYADCYVQSAFNAVILSREMCCICCYYNTVFGEHAPCIAKWNNSFSPFMTAHVWCKKFSNNIQLNNLLIGCDLKMKTAGYCEHSGYCTSE